MAQVIRIHEHGGPDVLRVEGRDAGSPGPGEVLIKQRAIGLNYIDVYHRTGLYTVPALPAIIGMEGAGEVLALGAAVEGLAAGDRVAYAGVLGGYASERLIPADRLVKLPPGIGFETAAAMMLRGMTARYLLKETFKAGPETVMLLHAAAGGVGLFVAQWARHLGARTIIGTAGSTEKGALALENGCTHIINYRHENFADRVREITNGALCDVVYDSVGRDTFPSSLDCLKPRGLGELRERLGASAAVRPRAARGQGFALRDAANTHGLYGAPGGSCC